MVAPEPALPPPWFAEGRVSAAERAFYVEEFRGDTIVVSMASPDGETIGAVTEAAAALDAGDARLVAVVAQPVAALVAALGPDQVTVDGPSAPAGGGAVDLDWLAELWLAITDHRHVVVAVPPGRELAVAAELAATMSARKLVVTDADGGWGRPSRSFADLATHAGAFESQLAHRQGGAVVAAVRRALDGGALNVNLCRPEELDRELFTFDGTGTLFTSGGYMELGPLRVDDLPAVERLVAQGTADGALRPRSRQDVARLAVTGLGARVVGRDHLAGLVSLETEAYRVDGVGEVACLYTVSRFSGSGAGAVLVDGIVARAEAEELHAVFAVTVSDAASAFFTRKGFTEVDADRVPLAKWDGYDTERRRQARVLWRDLAVPSEQGRFDW
ncbi:MAG: GNAT family N-acetyltransferase [Acidimicrobiales bacterium]